MAANLHNRSSADILGVGLGDRIYESSKLRVSASLNLPEDCYEVERLVAKKEKGINHCSLSAWSTE